MKALCENGLVIDCAGYKAIDSGVVLFGDADRTDVIGFVPNGKLHYLLPDDVVEQEHERLGVPAPTLSSPDDLEERLAAFSGELDDLSRQLDDQVRDLIDEGATVGEADFERQERLLERRRTIDRQLAQVQKRSHQLRQLSTTESAAEAGPVLDDITGLGPTYRARLHDAGITSVASLATQDPEMVAAAADAPESRAREWVEQATKMSGKKATTA